VGEKPIAYLWLPDFGAAVARRSGGLTADRPLVLLDEAGRVRAADARAAQAGVLSGLSERQAVARCPSAVFHPAARYPLGEAQAALWRQVGLYTDRWQVEGLGNAYLDAGLAGPGEKLRVWCEALAGAVRQLGWTPALGATGSKFGATVAGRVAQEKAVLLVPSPGQRAFLAGQPAGFLPLDADALLQLRHLGIRTLGQFAGLPAVGVLARFGAAGRTAQRWAQGLDDRPIVPAWEAPEVAARLEFEPPLADRDRLLAALTRQADRLLTPLRARLQAVGRVRLAAVRADGRTVVGGYIFPQPTAAPEAIRLGLAAALDKLTWDEQPAAEITLTLGDIRDGPVQQLNLFDAGLWPDATGDAGESRAALCGVLDRLAARYGADAFRMASLYSPDHPLPERRAGWRPFETQGPGR
jgi:nucleotidyltransferase/DNA polymerase involved in DNA repair